MKTKRTQKTKTRLRQFKWRQDGDFDFAIIGMHAEYFARCCYIDQADYIVNACNEYAKIQSASEDCPWTT